jgi:transcriptional regulator with XRE-family HTH domain
MNITIIKKTIGDRIKSLRFAKELTILELENLSDVSAKTIYDVEAGGMARIPTLFALSRALGVTLSDLFEGL